MVLARHPPLAIQWFRCFVFTSKSVTSHNLECCNAKMSKSSGKKASRSDMQSIRQLEGPLMAEHSSMQI